jgi:putative membrane protein
MWGFGWIFPMLFFVIVLAGCFVAARVHWGHEHGPFRGLHSASALQILSERFARGEISKEEFEERRATILRGL